MGDIIHTIELLMQYERHLQTLYEMALRHGGVLTEDEQRLADLCLSESRRLREQIAYWMAERPPSPPSQEPVRVLRRHVAPARPDVAPQRKLPPAIGPDVDFYGRVTRLCGEYPTHSTLDGGSVSGWHPELVPFSEMDLWPVTVGCVRHATGRNR